MKISVYRVFPQGSSANADSQHLFSIVATENCAHYATPNIANNSEWEAFDDKRIELALNMEETRPTSSLEWALVASKNISMLDVIPANASYDSIEEAISSENMIKAQACKISEESEI